MEEDNWNEASGRETYYDRSYEASPSRKEVNYVEEYEEEARQGRALIAVHAADESTAEQVRRVLVANGASRMRYYREHVIEDLLTTTQ